jgi:hypothetical protein
MSLSDCRREPPTSNGTLKGDAAIAVARKEITISILFSE